MDRRSRCGALLPIIDVVETVGTSEQHAPTSDDPPRSRGRLVRDVLVVWSVVAVIVLAVASRLLGTGEVAGTSMNPTLAPGDTLVTSTRSTPDIDDIVTANIDSPTGVTRSVVKRVVGVAGDVVSYVGCTLIRNGVEVDEPFVHPDTLFGSCGPSFDDVRVPAGHVWLMGDNRDNSSDSRAYGAVPVDAVDGVVLFSL
ncbi:MAG: signal peptidase I [Actinomycetota bacterium]